jgi:hypothetical protein
MPVQRFRKSIRFWERFCSGVVRFDQGQTSCYSACRKFLVEWDCRPRSWPPQAKHDAAHPTVNRPFSRLLPKPAAMIGHLLTSWTIRLALGFYVAFLAGWLLQPKAVPGEIKSEGSKKWRIAARWLWTAGCACFVLHVIAAFQFTHHLSNASAVAQTAKETKELLGVAFGEGIYFSYIFLAVWLADVAAWWFWGDAYLRRPRWLAGLVHGYLAFIAFNGAIVFEGGPTRWGGLLACAVLLGLLVARAREAAIPEQGIAKPSLASQEQSA